jgi:hypothetical protein
MVFELVVGLDRHVEKARELLVGRGAATLDDVRRNRVGGAGQLRSLECSMLVSRLIPAHRGFVPWVLTPYTPTHKLLIPSQPVEPT